MLKKVRFIYCKLRSYKLSIPRLPLDQFKSEVENFYKTKYKEYAKKRYKKYYQTHKKEENERAKKYFLKNKEQIYFKTRLKVLSKISSELKCRNCNCNDIRILEINHKNGGGRKEIREKYENSQSRFIKAILKGSRNTDDLEILCKICNILHHVQINLGIKGHEIRYNSL